MIRWLLAVVLVFTHADFAAAQDAALPSDFTKLVPSDSVGLLVLRDPRKLAELVERARVEADLDEEFADGQTFLRNILEAADFPVDMASLDTTRPIGIAYRFGTNSPEPVPAFIVPVSDVEAVMEALGSRDRLEPPIQSGSYIGVSIGGVAYRNDKPSRLINDIPSGLLVARIDLAAVFTKFKPVIDLGFDQFEQAMDSGMMDEAYPNMDTSEIFDVYLEIGHAIVDSADMLDATLDLRGGDLGMHFGLLSREKSPLSKYAQTEVVDYRALAGRLDPSSAVQMLTSYDQSGMLDWSWPMYEDMFADLERDESVPPALVAAMQSYLKRAKELMPKFGRVAATSFDIGGNGLRFAASYVSPDPQGLLKGMTEMLRDPSIQALGIGVSEPREAELGGTKGIGFEADFDVGKLLAALTTFAGQAGEKSDIEAEQIAFVEKFSANAFGKEGARFALLSSAERANILLGGDDAWRAGMAKRVTSGGELSPALARSVDAIAGMNPAMLLQIDLSRGLRGLAAWISMVGAEARTLDELATLTHSLGERNLPACMYWGASSTVWILGARIDFEGLLRLIKAVGDVDRVDTQRRQVQDHLAQISAALDEYARLHDGVYPQSLEPLRAKDAGGKALLTLEPKDPWGRPYLYEKRAGSTYRVRSLGADGKEGGTGIDADWDSSSELDAEKVGDGVKSFEYKIF